MILCAVAELEAEVQKGKREERKKQEKLVELETEITQLRNQNEVGC